MLFTLPTWWFGLHGCLFCGSLFPKADGLCEVCSSELWYWADEIELYEQQNEGLTVSSLFQWIPGRQQVLSEMILALKGIHGTRLWSFYAGEFATRFLCTHEAWGKPLLLVPSPSRNDRKDHATLFTEALSRVLSADTCPCLARQNHQNHQRSQSKAQRARIRFEWAENFSAQSFAKRSEGKRIVFIDDIVTTGATAKAVWKHLGKPKEFAIWSLAQRSLSCGASMDLV